MPKQMPSFAPLCASFAMQVWLLLVAALALASLVDAKKKPKAAEQTCDADGNCEGWFLSSRSLG